jgi:hypothetical protein
MTLFQELFHISTTQGNMLANATNPTCIKNVLELLLCKSYILECYAHDYFCSLTLLEDEQRTKCGGACWRCLTHNITANIYIKYTKFAHEIIELGVIYSHSPQVLVHHIPVCHKHEYAK